MIVLINSLFQKIVLHGVALVLIMSLTSCSGEKPVVRDKEPFIIGCNLPWLDGKMGWDIAYHPKWGYGFDFETADKYFADMHKMGIQVVRWWIFTDCRAGIVFDEKGYPLRIQDEVLNHLDFVMNELCPKYEISMYWCLLSGLLNTNHFNLITDPKIRRAYIQKVITPLAERYRNHLSLFAFDLMNEPESDIAGSSGNWSPRGIDWTMMRAFLKECADAIHFVAPNTKISVGSGWHGFENVKRGLYKDLGLDFYDFHLYTDETSLPLVESLKLDKPCLIGEYNTKESTAADESKQTRLVKRFLQDARAKGYMGVLVWSYDYPQTESAYGLLRRDGLWKAVGKVIQQFAHEVRSAN